MNSGKIFDKKEYKKLLQDELGEWKRIQKQSLKKGLPWWVDLQNSSLKGKNLNWKDDPKKEDLVRGKEKSLLIELALCCGKNILDIGCGSGWLSLELARRGAKVTAIDASPDRIRLAKKILAQNRQAKDFGSIKYLVADTNKIDFPANSFDAIVVWDSLHHFPYLDKILTKCDKWLKKDGGFIAFDHVGHWLLKLGTKIQTLIKKPQGKIIAYEDFLGKEVIDLLQIHYKTHRLWFRLCPPIAICLEFIFRKDIFFPLLPLAVRLDRLLCNAGIFVGEYFFFYGKKK